MKNKAVVDCKDKNNWTPLHHATTHDDATAVKLLLKRRAEIDSEDNWGNSSLMTGAKAGNVAAVVMLLQHGAQVELTNQDGDTFLDIAIVFRKEAVCKAALEDDRYVWMGITENSLFVFRAFIVHRLLIVSIFFLALNFMRIYVKKTSVV